MGVLQISRRIQSERILKIGLCQSYERMHNGTVFFHSLCILCIIAYYKTMYCDDISWDIIIFESH